MDSFGLNPEHWKNKKPPGVCEGLIHGVPSFFSVLDYVLYWFTRVWAFHTLQGLPATLIAGHWKKFGTSSFKLPLLMGYVSSPRRS